MNDTEIDRMLSRQDEILPSSGFVASVMDAVRNEAAAPPPIPFPWKRALPVFALAAAALVGVFVLGISGVAELAKEPAAITASPTISPLGVLHWVGLNSVTAWTGLSLLVAFISVRLSLRLAGGRS